mmetsp:Transcript_27264/g.56680  ORF Transcript_27264/g.56680 Transcript_27264/m.56680 type:complete len:259 (-) Transcript_27264:275-1051(-)
MGPNLQTIRQKEQTKGCIFYFDASLLSRCAYLLYVLFDTFSTMWLCRMRQNQQSTCLPFTRTAQQFYRNTTPVFRFPKASYKRRYFNEGWITCPTIYLTSQPNLCNLPEAQACQKPHQQLSHQSGLPKRMEPTPSPQSTPFSSTSTPARSTPGWQAPTSTYRRSGRSARQPKTNGPPRRTSTAATASSFATYAPHYASGAAWRRRDGAASRAPARAASARAPMAPPSPSESCPKPRRPAEWPSRKPRPGSHCASRHSG